MAASVQSMSLVAPCFRLIERLLIAQSLHGKVVGQSLPQVGKRLILDPGNDAACLRETDGQLPPLVLLEAEPDPPLAEALPLGPHHKLAVVRLRKREASRAVGAH